MVPTVEWKDGVVRILDQSRLPDQVEFVDCRDYETVGIAIKELWVRGAPAIGITAAMGVALGAQAVKAQDYDAFSKAVLAIADHLAATRPTAINLFWAIARMKRRLESRPGNLSTWKEVDDAGYVIVGSAETVRQRLEEYAKKVGFGLLIANFSVGNAPREFTEKSMRLSADKVMPKLRNINVDTPPANA